MNKVYLIREFGLVYGPLTEEEINRRIIKKEIDWSALVFVVTDKKWMPILQHPQFCAQFLPKVKIVLKKHSANSKLETAPSSIDENYWYIFLEGNYYGPYSQSQIIKRIQNKSLQEADYVWKPGDECWSRIAETREFSSEEIRKLRQTNEPLAKLLFVNRQHARAKYDCQLTVHDHKQTYAGASLEISSGGAGILIENQELKPGQKLFLHFRPSNKDQTLVGVPPFNAICEIVNKQYTPDKHQISKNGTPEAPLTNSVKYSVKFINVSSEVRRSIETYATANNTNSYQQAS